MEKLNLTTPDIATENIEKLGLLFPNCLTEKSIDGKIFKAIDFDILRQEVAHFVVEGPEQRYQFTWPDKRAAIRLANTPTSKTLRPCRAESVDFDTTQNLYIEGDNLDVLKLLRENYLGKVKMIYIDPPYNTGNDFVYNDDFAQGKTDFEQRSGLFDEEGNQTIDPMQRNTEANGRFHTDWLNMIYPRLKVARDLLSDDGVIFISIDDNEIENLKKVGNEIFGESNFVGQWNWFKSATPPNLSYKIKKNIEYIIAYEKHKDNIRYSGLQKVSSSSDPFTKPQNSLKVLTFPAGSIQTNLKDGVYSKGIYGTDKFPNELLNDLIVENGINSNAVSFRNKFIWVQSTLDENLKQKLKVYLSKSLVLSYKRAEYNPECPPNLIDQNVQVSTTEQAGSDLDSLFDKISVFDYPKPVSLLTYLLRFKNDPSSIVLDFFSGSATTAHAVMQLNAEDGGNRKFIMVQLPEKTDPNSEAYKAGYPNICEIGKERIRRAGKKIKEENKDKEAIDRLDTGFRVLKLDSSNMADVYYTPAQTPIEQTLGFEAFEDNIKPDRTAEDLLFQVMPECNLPLSSRIEEREIYGKKVYAVDDNYLVACFDRDIDEQVITEIARMQPYYFVMRDASAATDNVLDNFDQIFNAYSKETIRRIL
jgi:adenine-specific DNA-methyltransferase